MAQAKPLGRLAARFLAETSEINHAALLRGGKHLNQQPALSSVKAGHSPRTAKQGFYHATGWFIGIVELLIGHMKSEQILSVQCYL